MQHDDDRDEPGEDQGEHPERAPAEAGEPGGNEDVEQGAADVERLEGHSRPGGDAGGINPSRSQQSRRPEHD